MSEAYFTFPLWLLAYGGDDYKCRIQKIVSSGLVRTGESYIENPRNNQEIISEYLAEHKVSGFNRKTSKHLAVVAGAKLMNVTIHGVEGILADEQKLNTFCREKEEQHGKGPLVMIAANLLWGCHNDGFPTYRDFSTLCAINSVMGWRRAEPVRITRDMIIARQLGYKTTAVMRCEMFPPIGLEDKFGREDGAKPLTTQQVRDTLDRLERAEMIARCQSSKRVVYFSTGSREELRAKVKGIIDEKKKVETARFMDRSLIWNQKPTT